jgi:phosphopantothenate---cysteine ligase (CTP)
MRCVVTAGPTYEPMDKVRRLTNFSTGRLGSELADFLTARGHDVTLLIGAQATYGGGTQARQVEAFTTTADLGQRLKQLGREPVDALFHAAAVNDFAFGKIWLRSPQGQLAEVSSGKISTRQGTLLAELIPTPKLIAELRGWFPAARLVGWKYEVEHDRASAVRLAEQQITDYRTDACVVNGPAYGDGYGLVQVGSQCAHLGDVKALFDSLARFVAR